MSSISWTNCTDFVMFKHRSCSWDKTIWNLSTTWLILFRFKSLIFLLKIRSIFPPMKRRLGARSAHGILLVDKRVADSATPPIAKISKQPSWLAMFWKRVNLFLVFRIKSFLHYLYVRVTSGNMSSNMLDKKSTSSNEMRDVFIIVCTIFWANSFSCYKYRILVSN
jgi:hypothetical protein